MEQAYIGYKNREEHFVINKYENAARKALGINENDFREGHKGYYYETSSPLPLKN